jgi:hypothetical protein
MEDEKVNYSNAAQLGQKTPQEGRVTGAARERRWHECGLEEKVERLRNILRHDIRIAGQTLNLLSRDVRLLSEHTHDGRGQIAVPMAASAWSGTDPHPPGYSYNPFTVLD